MNYLLAEQILQVLQGWIYFSCIFAPQDVLRQESGAETSGMMKQFNKKYELPAVLAIFKATKLQKLRTCKDNNE